MPNVTNGTAPAVETTTDIVPAAAVQRYQPSLFNVDVFIGKQLGRVLSATPIKGKTAEGTTGEVGMSVGMGKRLDIAKALRLTGKSNKDALDTAILAATDDAFTEVKGVVASLSREWTLKKVAQRSMADGTEQLTIVAKKVKRSVGPSDEAIAKTLGIPVEEVAAMRARQEAALRGTIDVDATSTQA